MKQQTKTDVGDMSVGEKHLSKIARLPCCVCGTPATSEAHHIRDLRYNVGTGKKADDKHAIPLCFYHHRGGQGFHTLGKRRWEEIYGTQQHFLERTQRDLEMIERGL